MPDISVIVPVYNAEKYLNRCIDSVLSQSYNDFELILVNDGSQDGSLEICQEFAEKDNRIRVFSQANSGASAARNHGIDKANGEWITFVDADDSVDCDYLSEFVDLRRKYPNSKLFTCGLQIISDKTASVSFDHYTQYKSIEDFYGQNNVFQICGPYCKLFNLNILKVNTIHFSKRIRCAEDYGFLIDYLGHIDYIAVSPKYLYNYYKHQGSLSSSVYDYNIENSGFISLKKKYDTLIGIKHGASIKKQHDSFLAYYSYRVLCSIYNREGITLPKDVRIGRIEALDTEMLSIYRYDKSCTWYLKILIFLLVHRKYKLFDKIHLLRMKR